MSNDFNVIYLSDEGVKSRFEFLRDCFGYKTRTKFLNFIIFRFSELNHENIELRKQNEALKEVVYDLKKMYEPTKIFN